MLEPELIDLYGTIYEKVPAFTIEGGRIHPAFITKEGRPIAAFYVRQPLLLSACRLRSAQRVSFRDVDMTLFRDFDSRYREMTADQVDAYSRYLEEAFESLLD